MKISSESHMEVLAIHLTETINDHDFMVLTAGLQKFIEKGFTQIILDLTHAELKEETPKSFLNLKRSKKTGEVKVYLISKDSLIADSSNFDVLIQRVQSPHAEEFRSRIGVMRELSELQAKKKILEEKEASHSQDSGSLQQNLHVIGGKVSVLRKQRESLNSLILFLSANLRLREEVMKKKAIEDQAKAEDLVADRVAQGTTEIDPEKPQDPAGEPPKDYPALFQTKLREKGLWS